MRKLAVLTMLLCLAALAGCDSSGGGTPTCSGAPLVQAETSGDQFIALINECISNPLAQVVAKAQTTVCECPGGGDVTADEETGVATLNNCKTTDGFTFSGTMLFDTVTGEATVNLSTFACCTNVTGQNILIDQASVGCAGVITGTCGGEQVTCTVQNPSTGDVCDYFCT